MGITLAFDVYGTLIDPHGVTAALVPLMGEENAQVFSQTWRSKQLEYSFRRGLMRQYEEFTLCTRQALDYACTVHAQPLGVEEKQELMAHYLVLPAYEDVAPGLAALQDLDVQCFAFSNGVHRDIQTLLETAGVIEYMEGIVSVDEVQSFKPDPEVYNHFQQKTRATPADTWLISSNAFDVLGAEAVGWRTAWVQRQDNAVFDPWDIEPTVIITALTELASVLQNT